MKSVTPDPIAEKVRYYRIFLRLPQSFVAEKALGLDRTTYSRMESGKILFSPDNLKALANLYRVTVEEFFKPFHADAVWLKPLKDVGQFRIKDKLRDPDEEGLGAVGQGVKDLMLWAQDKENIPELERRQKRAAETVGKFNLIHDAVKYCRTFSEKHSIGWSLDINQMIMDEFGIWMSWNSLGAMSGIYLEQGTEITPKIKLPLPFIGINSGHPSERQRFSAAHELGHHLFGKNEKLGSPTKPAKDPEEEEADQFAADLLMDKEMVLSLFNSLTKTLGDKYELSSIVLLTANHLQVSYSALLNKLLSLGVIPFEKREELQSVKVRDLQDQLSDVRHMQKFEESLIKQCEMKLGKTDLYKVENNGGGPKSPGDLRFLQDYCYVDYLQTCKIKTPMDSGAIFQKVALYVFSKYPRYVS